MSLNTILERSRRYWVEVLLFLLVAIVCSVQLERYPPVWWDEGWTLMVARNWVAQGHYGLYQDGLPRDAGLSGGFPMVALVALGFRLFGVGIWQGRLPVVLATLATLALLYHFSYRWWGRKVALGTIFVCLILCPFQMNILFYARQTMGEIPTLCLILAGYACLEIAFKRTRLLLPVTVILWGIGIATKAQPLPFWIASVLLYIFACVIKREWGRSGWVLLTAIGAMFVYRLIGSMPAILTPPILGKPAMLEGLFNVTAFVLAKNVRWAAVLAVLFYGLPTLLGLAWSGWQILGELRYREKLSHPAKWAIWGFASSWFAWFLLLGMAWTRYLFPALVLASPFVAACISDLTRGYDVKWLMRQSARLLTGHEKRLGFQAFFVLLFISITLAITLMSSYYNLQGIGIVNPQAAALKLQEIVPVNALVETYDSEIMFLAPSIRFHYPPDQINVQAIKRGTINPEMPLDYDPLQANPDYLLLGSFIRSWGIYDAVLKQGDFKLQESFFGYDLYSRVR